MTEPENEARLRPPPGNGKYRCPGPGAPDSSERHRLFLKPVNEFGAAHATGGGFEHQALLFVHRSVDVVSVQREEGHHRSVRHGLFPSA
jgi:hypothetical protein